MKPEIVYSCPKCFASFPVDIIGSKAHGNFPYTPKCEAKVKPFVSVESIEKWVKENQFKDGVYPEESYVSSNDLLSWLRNGKD